MIIGERPTRLTSKNGVYVFKSHVTQNMKVKLEKTALNIVRHIQLNFNQVARFVEMEFSVMKQVIDRTTLNCIGHQATAFSIGVNYHSPCHIDNDMYYTLATVIAPKEVSADEVIYYFLFPACQIRIPLQTADSFLFNPSLYHLCSNSKYDGCYIMSAYVFRKTVLRSNPL